MAMVIVEDSILLSIANAIRSKNGSEEKYKPSEMAQAIATLNTVKTVALEEEGNNE